MAEITDEFMKQMLTKSKNYCIVILKHGPKYGTSGFEKIIWEHGRRNFSLRSEGLLSIVCPITDDSNYSGIGIFNSSLEKTQEIMDNDPGVVDGIFIYEIHPCRSFPGDVLP